MKVKDKNIRGYNPEYAKGQILVGFRKNEDIDFVRGFGKGLGYELSDEEYAHGDNVYVYLTKSGKEKQAAKTFESHEELISWADRRDIKLEKRWTAIEQIKNDLTEIIEHAELPDLEYRGALQKIIEKCQEAKDK